MIETETIDRLFLELSQFTQATTAKELKLLSRISELESQLLAENTKGRNQGRLEMQLSIETYMDALNHDA